ncbi:uncharacterized protein LOC123322723 [Coccinella septempunctata]|uniref:uncharacterized protein LOC123322723 n=1 Tax=Coccinella septempunctata TaxID=41139 RepID=UPI001D0998DA|nr:uncharacterized protein LOC123322723 [Coccinella septempunctata]
METGTKELVICSAYFPGDAMFPPPNEVRKLVAFCRGKNLQLLVACDANSHHTTWGSTDINERGEHLFDFILEEALFVLNRGSVPTFVTKNRAEVLDIKLCSQYLSTKITDWRVSDTPSGSDHRNIQFNIELGGKPIQEYRNPRLTDWDGYKLSLQRNLRSINVNVNNHEDLERLANSMGQAIVSAYHDENCPLRKKSDNRKVSWWNSKLEKLRKEVRKKFNGAKSAGEWEVYRQILTLYNKEVRKAKRESWENFCSSIEDAASGTRLHKILSREPSLIC